jgi:hypothetical protein
MRVLSADVSIVCFDENGALDPAYRTLVIVGILLALVWSIGVPLCFAVTLYRHRSTIQAGNHHFVGVAHLRPLFMFFKPKCYMYEIYFMIEKLLLAGFVGMLKVYTGGTFVPCALAMIIITYMLCLVASARPSKTEPYNTAMIMSHSLILGNLVLAVAIRNSQKEDAWLTPEVIGMTLTFIQVPFWIYLIKVSFGKLKEMCESAKKEVRNAGNHKKLISIHHEKQRRSAARLGLAKARLVRATLSSKKLGIGRSAAGIGRGAPPALVTARSESVAANEPIRRPTTPQTDPRGQPAAPQTLPGGLRLIDFDTETVEHAADNSEPQTDMRTLRTAGNGAPTTPAPEPRAVTVSKHVRPLAPARPRRNLPHMQRVTSTDFQGVSVAEPSGPAPDSRRPTKHIVQGKWFQDYKKKMESS